MSTELESPLPLNSSPSDQEPEVPQLPPIPEEPEDLSVLTPIQTRYTFWYRASDFEQKNGSKVHVTGTNYKDTIKKIASFGTVSQIITQS